VADTVHAAAVRVIGQSDPGWVPWSTAPGVNGSPVDRDGYASVRALL